MVCAAALLLAAALVGAVEVERHHHKHHRHHAPSAAPPLFAAAAPSVPDLFRFTATDLAATPKHKDVDKDIVRSVYNLLSKSRDMNVEDTSKLQREKLENQKKWRELQDKANLLRQRAEMLARLEFCLQQDSSRNTSAVNSANSTVTASNAAALQLAMKKEADVKTRTAALDAKEKNLIAREAALKVRLEDARKKEVQLAQQANKQLASAKGGSIKSETKVKYVKVPKIVYRDAPKGCSRHTKCGQCSADGGCGWCGATKKCHERGNTTSSAQCDAASWSVDFCKDEACSQHLVCSSCMADPRCGMCSGKCMAGTLTGPAGSQCSSWQFALDMRFLSLNTYGRDTRNQTGRAAAIFKLIKEADADFVALQEVEDWFLAALAKESWALNYHSSDFGSSHAPGGLVMLSKLPLESVNYIESTAPGQIEVDQRGRALIVRPKIGSRNLMLATTTLDWRNANNRAASLDFVFSSLNSTNADVVLMGDFNFDVNALPESQHVPASYVDVWGKLHPKMKGYTWDPVANSYAKSADPTSSPSRIDRMLVSSQSWSPSKINKIGCPEASPHYGLLAEFSLYGAYC